MLLYFSLNFGKKKKKETKLLRILNSLDFARGAKLKTWKITRSKFACGLFATASILTHVFPRFQGERHCCRAGKQGTHMLLQSTEGQKRIFQRDLSSEKTGTLKMAI